MLWERHTFQPPVRCSGDNRYAAPYFLVGARDSGMLSVASDRNPIALLANKCESLVPVAYPGGAV